MLDFILGDGDLHSARLAVVLIVAVPGTISAFELADLVIERVGNTGVRYSTFDHQEVDRCDQVASVAAIVLVVTVNHVLR